MTTVWFSHVARRALFATVFLAPCQAGAQFRSSLDLSSRNAGTTGGPWLSQLALSPSARFDVPHFSLDGRWTALRTEGGDLTGDGELSATYFSPVRGGFQLSLAGFADRVLMDDMLAVSRAGTDARLSYRLGATGAWLGREVSADNKATPVSAVPRASGGAWHQWGTALVTLSMSSYATREGRRSPVVQIRYPTGPLAPPPGIDSIPRQTQSFADSQVVVDSGSAGRRRSWNDAELALHWGIGRLAFRGVIGTRVFTAHQPNELWGQVHGAYVLTPDLSLIAATGIHPSAAAYGATRARFLEVGFRMAPSALVRPRLPRGVRPVAAAFEVSSAVDGRRTLRIRVPNARTVELSGDFTGWKPITLTPAGTDRWEATLSIAPGLHRVAIRVDGDAWTPPPGVPAVPDEFQGTVGIILVKN